MATQSDHHATLIAYAATARAVPPSQWNEPATGGKWSPAQVTEHLRMTYTVVNAELEGGQGLRLRSSLWFRTFLRLVYLGKILRTGMMPRGALAPREVRPGPGPFDQELTISAMEKAADSFESKLAGREAVGGAVLTHHLFGRITGPKAWRFMAVHTEHHRRQLQGEAG